MPYLSDDRKVHCCVLIRRWQLAQLCHPCVMRLGHLVGDMFLWWRHEEHTWCVCHFRYFCGMCGNILLVSQTKIIKMISKKRRHVVFVESHQQSIIKAHTGQQGSPPYFWPLVRLSKGPFLGRISMARTSRLGFSDYLNILWSATSSHPVLGPHVSR